MKNLYKAIGVAAISSFLTYGSPVKAESFPSDYASQFSARPMDSELCYKIRKDDVVRIVGGENVPNEQVGRNIVVNSAYPNPLSLEDDPVLDWKDCKFKKGASKVCVPASIELDDSPLVKTRTNGTYETFTPHQLPGVLDPQYPIGIEIEGLKNKARVCYAITCDDKNPPRNLEDEIVESFTVADLIGQRRLEKLVASEICVPASISIAKEVIGEIYGAKKKIGTNANDPNEPLSLYQTGVISAVTTNLDRQNCFIHFANTPGCTDPDGITGPLDVGDGQLGNPTAIVVDPTNGDRYILDNLNARVQVFDSNYNFKSKWGTIGSGEGELSLTGLFGMDMYENRVLIADSANNKIIEFDKNGNYVREFTGLNNPLRLDIDSFGETWVTDSLNGRILHLDQSLSLLEQIAYNTYPGQGTPKGIAVDRTRNRMIVTDESPFVNLIDLTSKDIIGSLSSTSREFSAPSPVYIEESTGNVIFNDQGDNLIYIFNSNNEQILETGGEGLGIGLFEGYASPTVDPISGKIITVDINPRVTEFFRGDSLD